MKLLNPIVKDNGYVGVDWMELSTEPRVIFTPEFGVS